MAQRQYDEGIGMGVAHGGRTDRLPHGETIVFDGRGGAILYSADGTALKGSVYGDSVPGVRGVRDEDVTRDGVRVYENDHQRDDLWIRDQSVLHDDFEEDVVGSDLHQRAIRALTDGLLEVQGKRDAPWHVGSQLTTYLGSTGDKDNWGPMPDVLVHPTAGPVSVGSLDCVENGPLALVIEVASFATYRYDLEGKRHSYETTGVEEYLVYDVNADLLGEHVRAWRRGAGGYEPWLPDAAGRWRSRTLDVSFQVRGLLLRIIDSDGEEITILSEARRLVESEARRAESERRQADEARQFAESETLRADAAQRRIEELERLLRGKDDPGSNAG